MISYKDELNNKTFRDRIKNFSSETTDVSSEISFILENFDQLNDKSFQLEILDFLRKVSNIEDSRISSVLSNFPLIDFLLVQFQSSFFENEKEILIEIIGSLLKNSEDIKTDELLDFLLFQIFYPISVDISNSDFIYHTLYAIYQFFSKKYFEAFDQNHFFEQLCQLFNITPEIDMLLLQFSLKSARTFQYDDKITSFILLSIEFYNETTSDIISIITYSIYKRDPKILNVDLVKDAIVEYFSNSNNYISQKYALKLFYHLQEGDIYFLTYSPIITKTILAIFNNTNHCDNHPLLKFAIPVIYRTLQLSLPLAEKLFFNEENKEELIFLISDIILEDNYELRNLATKVFALVMRNLPREIFPFLQQPELTQTLYEILLTVIDMDENEDTLILFMISVDKFIDVLSTDCDLLLNFTSIFQSDEILEKISNLSESENGELAETFQLISERLDLIENSSL